MIRNFDLHSFPYIFLKPITDALAARCVNTVRLLSADMVEKANSGHPGAPMGCAPIAHVLWSKIMRYDTAEPKWLNRDRFVLSNGHSCALLYSMLHLTGYDLPMSELQRFRKIDAITAGHPENILVSFITYSSPFLILFMSFLKCNRIQVASI